MANNEISTLIESIVLQLNDELAKGTPDESVLIETIDRANEIYSAVYLSQDIDLEDSKNLFLLNLKIFQAMNKIFKDYTEFYRYYAGQQVFLRSDFAILQQEFNQYKNSHP